MLNVWCCGVEGMDGEGGQLCLFADLACDVPRAFPCSKRHLPAVRLCEILHKFNVPVIPSSRVNAPEGYAR